MKYPFSFLFATAASLASLSVTTVAAQTILDVVVGSQNHTLLAGAVGIASPEFAALFSNSNISITLFAPDDDAMAAIDPLLYTPPWVNHLNCVLLGHVYALALPSTDIAGPMTVDSAMPGYLLNIDGPDPVIVNEIPVSVPDIVASNGVIHSLSTGLLLPTCATQDLDDTLASGELPTLMMLVGLIRSEGLEDLRALLKGAATASGLTVLAPTDAAFANMDQMIFQQIASDPVLLAQVISYHIIPANFNESWSGTIPTMLAGETVNVTMVPLDGEEDDLLKINDDATATNSTFASNGIIIEIDRVLIPPSLQQVPTDPPPPDSLPPAEQPPPSAVPPLEPTTVPPLFPTVVPPLEPTTVPPLFPTAVPPPTTIVNPAPTIPDSPLPPPTTTAPTIPGSPLPPPTTTAPTIPGSPLPLESPTIVPDIPEEEEQEENLDDPSTTPDDVPPSRPAGKGKGGYNPPAAKGKGKGYYYHSHGHGGHYHPAHGGIFQRPMKPPRYGYSMMKSRGGGHQYYGYGRGMGGSMMHSGSYYQGGYDGKGKGGGGGRGYYVRVSRNNVPAAHAPATGYGVRPRGGWR